MTTRAARFRPFALLSALAPAMMLVAAAPQPPATPPAPPADKPATIATPAAPAAPLTAAEKPLVGRWSIDHDAALAAIKKAQGDKAGSDAAIDRLISANFNNQIDLTAAHAVRILGGQELGRGAWSLAADKLDIKGAKKAPAFTLKDGKLWVTEPTTKALLPYTHAAFGPSPTTTDLKGPWKIDVDAFKKTAAAKVGEMLAAMGSAGAPKEQVDMMVNQMIERMGKLTATFNADNTMVFDTGDGETHKGAWTIEDDLVAATDATDDTDKSTNAFVYRDHTLSAFMGPLELTFIPATTAGHAPAAK